MKQYWKVIAVFIIGVLLSCTAYLLIQQHETQREFQYFKTLADKDIMYVQRSLLANDDQNSIRAFLHTFNKPTNPITVDIKPVKQHTKMPSSTLITTNDQIQLQRLIMVAHHTWLITAKTAITNLQISHWQASSVATLIFLCTLLSALLLMYSIRNRAHEQERQKLEAKSQYYAYSDPLTKINNRLSFDKNLATQIEISQKNELSFALLYIDVNKFKQINDQHGHAAGDQALIHVAKQLEKNLRHTDNVYRIGGDEFAVILADLKTRKEAEFVAEKITTILNQPFSLSKTHQQPIQISIGIALYPEDASDIATLKEHADQAMYQAKNNAQAYC